MREQAERFGVELLVAQTVASIDTSLPEGEKSGMRAVSHTVATESGQQYRAPALLLAPGTRYRRLNVPGEDDFIGAGVHFCATCDGPFYRDLDTLVVGGGNSGIEEGLFLTRFASRVTVLEVGDRLRASQVLQDKAAAHPQMDVRLNTTVREFRGNGKLESVLVEDLKTGQQQELHPAGVFVFIGLDPNTGFLSDVVELDQRGFIVTGSAPDASMMETNRHGIFAAGDARAGSTKQVAAAVGEGAAALIGIRAHMEDEIRNRGYSGD